MVKSEELAVRALRAYEIGRLWKASRVALVLLPVTVLCLLENRSREACACFAVILLASAIWLRFRDRAGMDSVTTGLLAGALPLAAGLAFAGLDLRCGLAGSDSYCTAFSLLIGAGAGLVIARRETRARGRFTSFVTAGAIAGLATALGCLRLGVVGLASMLLGVALGSVVGAAALARAER